MSVPQDEIGKWPTENVPDSWVWANLNDIFIDKTSTTKKLPQKYYSFEGNYPVIDQGEKKVGGFTNNTSLLYNGGLPVIVWGDHTKCVKYIEESFVQGADGVKILVPNEEVFPRYCYFLLKTIILPNKGYSRHFKYLSASHFPLPPLAEQRRIAAKLDSLFARTRRAGEELGKIPQLIEHYKQAILSAAFRGDLTKDWRAENGITSKWHETTLGDALTDIRYGTSKKCDSNTRNVPVLRIPNITEKGILLDDLKFAEFTQDEHAKLALRSGDILIIRSNGSLDLVGRAALVSEKEQDFLYAGYLIRLRLLGEVEPKFILYFLYHPDTRRQIETLAKSTSGVNNINAQEIKSLPLKVPSFAEQIEIVRRLDIAFESISKLVDESEKALKLVSHLDQAHLAKAFRGELVPQDPNDEPASILLERIRAERETKPTTRRKQRNPDMVVEGTGA